MTCPQESTLNSPMLPSARIRAHALYTVPGADARILDDISWAGAFARGIDYRF
jgi:hypothetical protein